MHTYVVLAALGFPWWLRAAHWLNVFFIGFLIRGGIQILGSLPKLYWRDAATPGTEWLKFTRKQVPRDRLWISLEEEVEVSPWLGQPGGNNLGLGRHWHFFAVIGWILTGVIYVILLFATGEWTRLIPTSWSIFPAAWHTFLTYITFHLPPASAFHPYDPLQQLSYAAVVFLLGPFLIVTGAAQSPAIEGRFPWYVKIFGGRQSARSLHFLGLVAFVLFIIVHTALVIITGFPRNIGDIILGQHQSDQGLALGIGLGTIAAIFLIYALTSWYSLRHPRVVQRGLGAIVNTVRRALFLHLSSHQHYAQDALSPFFRVNGYPPTSQEYQQLAQNDFRDWRLEIKGLVERPLCLSLDDIKGLRKVTQITKHNCIQGWTAIGEWGGVPLTEILERCKPLPTAHFLIFHSYQDDEEGGKFYEAIEMELARHHQTILAYEMNGEALSIPHGAPLRLRIETQLGFKMVKWIRAIECVEDFRAIGAGQGGSREDTMYYDWDAGI